MPHEHEITERGPYHLEMINFSTRLEHVYFHTSFECQEFVAANCM